MGNPNSASRYVNKHHQNHVNHVSPRDRSIRANHASDSIFTAEEEDESNDSESQYISDDQCDSIDNLSDINDMHQDNDTIGSNDGGSCANNEEDYDDGNEDYDCYDDEGCYDDGDDDCYDDGVVLRVHTSEILSLSYALVFPLYLFFYHHICFVSVYMFRFLYPERLHRAIFYFVLPMFFVYT